MKKEKRPNTRMDGIRHVDSHGDNVKGMGLGITNDLGDEKINSNGAKTRGSWAMLALVGVFFLLTAGCVASAGPANEPIYGTFKNYWQPWERPMLIAISIGVAMVALSWMYGYIASDEKFKAWAKKELVESVYSVLILITAIWLVSSLGFYMAMLPGISPWHAPAGQVDEADAWRTYVLMRCGTTSAVLPGEERPCHIRLAEDYLQILATGTQMQAEDILTYYTPLSVVSTIGVRLNAYPDPAGEFGFSPFVGLGAPLETLSALFDIATKNLMSLRFQQYVIDFMHLAFFPLFMTMGLFFRALYFTRRLGGLLIAIALGFYLVFPMMYVFFHAVLFSVSGMGAQINTELTDMQTTNPDGVPVALGHQLYPVNVYDNAFRMLVQPEDSSVTRAPGCRDGKLQPGEECNEPDNATYDGGVFNGKVHEGPLVCPPIDEYGQVIESRKNDIRCDTNACQCAPLYGPGHTGDFRADYGVEINSATRAAQVRNTGALLAQVCSPPPTTDQAVLEQRKENQKSFLFQGQASGLTAVTRGFVKAMGIALANDELLGANGFIDNMAKLIIFSAVAPFLAIMAALAGVKALSPMLGGDVEIAGLTRLI